MNSIPERISEIKAQIENARQFGPDGLEYWSARTLAPVLGYRNWEQVPGIIERASLASENTGSPAANHFRPASKMVPIGSGSSREVLDFHMSRYGCYLFAMNGDPRKVEISCAQSYFAARTHEAEVRAALPAPAAAPALPSAVGMDFLQQFAGNVVLAIQQQAATTKEEVKAEIRTEIAQQIGALPATGAERSEVRRLVRQVVSQRTRLGLKNNTFSAAYTELWDACAVGKMDQMTRDDAPRVLAYLNAQLVGLTTMTDSGLFGGDQQ